MELTGQIRADGQGSGNWAGAGSGGSVWLEVGVLSGGGLITANGGNGGTTQSGGGGGGRLAVYCTDATGFDLSNRVQCIGGMGSAYGGAGTLYLKDAAQPVGVVRVDNTGRGSGAAATELATNLTEALEFRNARVTVAGAVTSLTVVVTNCVVTQSSEMRITNLTVVGGTWTQSQTIWVQDMTVSGGTWAQNAALTALGPWLSVSNTTWTQNGVLTVANLAVTGGSWDQNTNLVVTALVVSNGTWTQDYALTLTDLTVAGVTWTVNKPLTVTGRFTRSGLTLIQNAPVTLPTDDLVVDDWIYTLNTSQTWDRVELLNGGKLTHSLANAGMHLVANTVVVDSNSLVDVTALGGGFTGSGGNPGGSHGGLGGAAGGTPNAVHGDLYHPLDLGSGGYNATRGGGKVRITAEVMDLAGQIRADGQGVGSWAGAGSGGSVWLDVGVLGGGGLITANGGNGGTTQSGGGGGGRIAVYYAALNGFNTNRIYCIGGTGSAAGQKGTIYPEDVSGPVRVVHTAPQGVLPSAVSRIQVVFIPAINGSSFTLADVAVMGPGGAITPESITPSNAVTFLIHFSSPLGEGTYTLAIGPDILSTNGVGMDQDRDGTTGEATDDVYRSGFRVDLTPPAAPVVTNYPMSPATTEVAAASALLMGTRETDTSVWVDGVPRAGSGSSPWSCSRPLSQGTNRVTLFAIDLAGLRSTTNVVWFFADSVPPVIAGVWPPDRTITASNGMPVELTVTEVTSGVDLPASSLSIMKDGTTPVSGVWTTLPGRVVFTPAGPWADGEHTVAVTLKDRLGNASTPFASRFTVDTAPPAPPSILPVVTPTTEDHQLIRGSREPYAEIRMDGSVVASHSVSPDWSHEVSLNVGENIFRFTAVDRAGNPSAVAEAVIMFEPTWPTVVLATPSHTNPVPFTTNFFMTLRFDRSMKAVPEPSVLITNATSGRALGTSSNGVWWTSTLSNDTYRTPRLAFTNGMDGSYAVSVSGAQSRYGLLLQTTNVAALTVNSTLPTNPVPAVTAQDRASVTLAWKSYDAPPDLAGLRLYRQTTPFTSVTGLTPWTTLGKTARQYVFTDLQMDRLYYVAVVAVDEAGNLTSAVEPITLCRESTDFPPAAPSVNAVTSPTTIRSQVLGGRKDAGTDVRMNSTLVVSRSSATNWSYTVRLNPGTNSLAFTSVDELGYLSTATVVTIVFDDQPPGPVDVVGNGEGDGMSVALSWAGYDETANGADIHHYTVYLATDSFANTAQASPTGTVLAGVKQFTVRGLARNQTYYLAVVAVDERNNVLNAVTPVSVTTHDIVAPANPSGLRFECGRSNLTVRWTPPADADFAGCRVYLTNAVTPVFVGADTNALTVSGLQRASAYAFRVSSVDGDGNESAGVSATGVTLLDNPTNVVATPWSSLVELRWDRAMPTNLLKHYAIYASTSTYASVSGMTAVATAVTTNAAVAGLENDRPYYFGIVAVNLSDGFDAAVTPVTATPRPDTAGPAVSNVTFAGLPLTNDLVVVRPGTIRAIAQDHAGVSRIEFRDGDQLIATDANGNDGYSATWDIGSVPDGVHALRLDAFDTLGNRTTVSNRVVVALAAPTNAPVIRSPASGLIVNTPLLMVSGLADPAADGVVLYDNAAFTGTPAVIAMDGAFSIPVVLAEGTNRLEAAAKNRGGVGPRSAMVTVVVDTTVPGTPMGVEAETRAEGLIRLRWWRPAGPNITGYAVFRANQTFESVDEAVHVNDQAATTTAFDDLPPTDGTWYYRIMAVNALGTRSPLSAEVSAISDRAAPRARIGLQSTGPRLGDRLATGTVSVALSVSERLVSVPFLSLVRTNALPLSIGLTKVNDTNYTGTFTIRPEMPSGLGFFTFSARDVYNNRGTEIDEGGTLMVDTIGPAAPSLNLSPGAPLRNSATNPVSLTLELVFDPLDLPAAPPSLSYALSITHPAGQVLTLTHVAPALWRGTLPLPAEAGATNEWLSFAVRAEDPVGNVTTNIAGADRFQVYQGTLPVLAAPEGLSAVAVTGGQVRLAWQAVGEAADYAVYRQAPGQGSLQFHALSGGGTSLSDMAPDGTNGYAVAAVRAANGQACTGGLSQAVTVIADGTPPGAPTVTELSLYGAGLQVAWTPPAGGEALTYRLYRTAQPVTNTATLTALLAGLAHTRAVDANPARGLAYYAVTALDRLGNESAPSASVATNLARVPVNSLTVLKPEEALPVVGWTHTEPASISGFNLYLSGGGETLKLNSDLLPNSTRTYMDTGYDGSNRLYALAAVDVAGGTEYESARRSLLLPALNLALATNAMLSRGVMNRVKLLVGNDSGVLLSNVVAGVEVLGRDHWSDPVVLPAGVTTEVAVAVGGYADLPEAVTLTNAILLMPNAGESATLLWTRELAVKDDALSVDIVNDELNRGASGNVRFVLHNTSDEEIEIIMARPGGASPDVRLVLADPDGMVYATVPAAQLVGPGLFLLSDGTTVARLAPGRSFTSAPFVLAVPASAPAQMNLRLEVDHLYYHHGRENQVTMNGLESTAAVVLGGYAAVARQTSLTDDANAGLPAKTVLMEISYTAQVTNVTPGLSYGNEPVRLTGTATDRTTGGPRAGVDVRLVIAVNGFERAYRVVTDAGGQWSYAFAPGPLEGGHYTAYAVHPYVTERREQASFDIQRVIVRPERGTLTVPRGYGQTIDIQVSSLGATLSNTRLVYEAADQPGGSFTAGISVTPDLGLPTLADGQNGVLHSTISAATNAPSSGRLVLRVRSDSPAPGLWGTVTIDYTFVDPPAGVPAGAAAFPVLYRTPEFIETGVAISNTASETVTLGNRGYGPLQNVRLALVQTNGLPAPAWVVLNAPATVSELPVGASQSVGLLFAPDASVPPSDVSPYSFLLRITADHYPTSDVPLMCWVNQSGRGNALFKLMDIYTGTLNAQNEPIEGLAGAQVKLVKEDGAVVVTSRVTDVTGEAWFEALPVGRYAVRLTCAGHDERTDRIWIKPGLTTAKDYTLLNTLFSVEWSVTEITIQDRYEIVLRATYAVDVPAAVVAVEPLSITLPEMNPGDVLQGEYTLKNHGLIRAEQVELFVPQSDAFYKFELMADVPEALEAKQVVRVPYRITCLSRFDAGEAAAGGAGECRTYRQCGYFKYVYRCINGQWVKQKVPVCIERTTCINPDEAPDYAYLLSMEPEPYGVHGNLGAGVSFPIAANWGGSMAANNDMTLDSGGRYGGGRRAEPVANVECKPRPEGAEDDACAGYKAETDTSSSVDLTMGEYRDSEVDLDIKVLGHRVPVRRFCDGTAWKWSLTSQDLTLRHEVTASGSVLSGLQADGVAYAKVDEAGRVYAYADRRITVETNGFRRTDTGGNWKWYDENGRLSRYGDRNGRTVLHGCDEQGRVTGVFDHFTNQVYWIAYTNHRIASVSDRSGGGRTVQYAYDARGNLTNVIDVLGYATAFGYDAANHVVYKRTPDGTENFYTYNVQGHVSEFRDTLGHRKTFAYDYDPLRGEYYAFVREQDGKVTESWFDQDARQIRRDINGETVARATSAEPVYETDENGNITRTTHPDGSSTRRQYDPVNNRLLREENELGVVTLHAYDARGNETNRTEAAGSAAPRVSSSRYDPFGNLLSVSQLGNASTPTVTVSFAYDDAGNRIRYTDAEGYATHFTYDRMGNLLTLSNALGQVWSNQYDAAGHLLAAWNPKGVAISNAYNAIGQILRRYDAGGRVSTYTYDADGRVATVTDPYGRLTTRQYTADGWPSREVDPDGNERGTDYDAAGRAVRTWTTAGWVTALAYDAYGRLVKATDPDGAVHTVEYDEAGHPWRSTHAGSEERAEYDARGRAVRVVVSAAGESRTNRVEYDAAGRVLQTIGPEGFTTAKRYDELNRLTQVVRGGLQTNWFEYDLRNNVVRQVDALGRETRVDYDRRSLPVRKTYADGSSNTAAYDAMGRITEFTDAKGQQMRCGYDELGALTGRQYFAAGDLTQPVLVDRYQYDEGGRLTNWTDGVFEESWVYDDANRRIEQVVNYGAFSKRSTRAYDARLRTTRFEGPDGTVLDHTYGPNGLLNAVAIVDEGAVTINAYEGSRVARMTFPGGTTREFSFGPLALQSERLLDAASNVLDAVTYRANRESRVTEIGTPAGAQRYAYSALGELAAASVPGLPEEVFGYDAAGNRTAGPALTNAWGYNLLNQLTSVVGRAFAYDVNGSLVARWQNGNPTATYEYDPMNRLVAIRDAASNLVARYAYDAEGRRLMKEVGGTRTYFFYSDQGLVAEFDAAGQPIRAYGYGNSPMWGMQPLFLKTGGKYHYYVHDHLGAPRLLVDRNGAVTWRARIAAFGRTEVEPSSTVDNPLRLSAQYYDAESGLHYNTRRYYDPELGRYLSRDLLGEGGGRNLYGFAGNDPLNAVDPKGMAWKAVNCGELDKSVEFGVKALLGLEIKAGVKGKACDCCETTTGKVYEWDQMDANVYVAAEASFGIEGGVAIFGTLYNVGINLFKIQWSLLNGKIYTECGHDEMNLALSTIVEVDLGYMLELKGLLILESESTAEWSISLKYRMEAGLDARGKDDLYVFAKGDLIGSYGGKAKVALDVLKELLGAHWVTEIFGDYAKQEHEVEGPKGEGEVNVFTWRRKIL
jgi:RHS repeat-associated protein